MSPSEGEIPPQADGPGGGRRDTGGMGTGGGRHLQESCLEVTSQEPLLPGEQRPRRGYDRHSRRIGGDTAFGEPAAGGDPVALNTPFKQCPLCEATWVDLSDFVTDLCLRVDGYQACFPDPEWGLILLTHEADHCGTTLAVRATFLKVLHDGPFWSEHRTGLDDCLRLCLDQGRLEECTAECDMAWVRAVLQWLRRHELPPHVKRQG